MRSLLKTAFFVACVALVLFEPTDLVVFFFAGFGIGWATDEVGQVFPQ